MKHISMPALRAMQILEENGYEAFFAGGCVRDSVMNILPHDWDIATSALPLQTLEIFQAGGYNVVPSGIKHGTVTAIVEGEPIEITTYRKDANYSDLRRPDSVEFVTQKEIDVRRRDFTMNALLYNPRTGIFDLVGGIEDINRKTIRAVGNPDDRFSEDALRIIRALRFSSTLEFNIEPNTSYAIFKNKKLLNHIASERLHVELNNLLLGKNVESVLTQYAEIIKVIIPEIGMMFGFAQNNPHHGYDVWTHTIKAIAAAPFDLKIRLTLLLHDIGKPQCHTVDTSGVDHFYKHPVRSAELSEKILHKLKYSNDIIDSVVLLITYHDFRIPAEHKSVKNLLKKTGEENFRLLLKIREADILAQSTYYREEKLDLLRETEQVFNEIIVENQCFKLSDLDINGNDLIELGIVTGKKIGIILSELLNMVIDEQLPNEKHALLNYAKIIDKTKNL